jgi:hypothetical protein
MDIHFTDRILQNPRKIKGSYDYFRRNQHRNTLAYYDATSVTKEKGFLTLKAALYKSLIYIVDSLEASIDIQKHRLLIGWLLLPLGPIALKRIYVVC